MKRSRSIASFVLAAGLGVALLGSAAPTPAPTEPLAVWVWGSNRSGQLGRPTQNFHIPAMLDELGDVIAVAGGGLHSLALERDGTVWAWGDGSMGQLGSGTTEPGLLPRRVEGLEGITEIAAGDRHSLALRGSDHKLWLWGSNQAGQLGLDSNIELATVPVELGGELKVASARAGGMHTLLLDTSGQLWALGSNIYGQLGNGTTQDSHVPVKVAVPVPITSFAAGQYHNLAIGPGGKVWGFGINSFGELGNGQQGGWVEAFSTPVTASLPPVVEVAAGQLHSIARTATGDVWGWGYNTSGQVGDGSVLPANTGRLTPAKLDVHGIVSIAAGGVQNVALGEDGGIWVWGANRYGACGNGSRVDARVPTLLTRVGGGVAIAMGGAHGLVVARSRPPLELYATGDNARGQLGDGTNARRSRPERVSGLGPVLAASAGAAHSLAVTVDHRLWAWGENTYGQLGLRGGDRTSPEEVELPLAPGVTISTVAAGGGHSLVLASDGRVWAFGDDELGQLGDSATASRYQPAIVPGLSHVSAIAAGPGFSLALRDDGTVLTWGSNQCGEVGQSPRVPLLATPKLVSALSGVTAIAAGACHAVALTSRGTVAVWGSNDRAQLGLGAPSGRVTTPTEVPMLNDVVAVVAGAFHTLALLSDGSVWGFGDDTAGQLGPTSGQGSLPRRLTGEGAADLLGAGFFHGLLASPAGQCQSFGLGRGGQLGGGRFGDFLSPSEVAVDRVRWLSGGASHTLFGIEAAPL